MLLPAGPRVCWRVCGCLSWISVHLSGRNQHYWPSYGRKVRGSAPPGGSQLTSIQPGPKAGVNPPEPASPPSGLPLHPLNLHTPGLRTHREPHRISASPNRTHPVGDPGAPEGKGGAPASPRRQGPRRRQALSAPAGPSDLLARIFASHP